MNYGSKFTNDLIKKINPTVLTAGSSLFGSAAMGDPDSRLLVAALTKDTAHDKNRNRMLESISEEEKSDLVKLSQAISSAMLARYNITNSLFDSLKMTTFMDIGCGFTQRGIEFSKKKGTTYYGIDLPSVTERMIPAVTSVIGTLHLYNRIFYQTADATDRNALRAVIRGRSPLFISTEGVMMYLTVPEAISVTDNICSLLEEFGGVWVTADPEMSRLNDRIISNVFGEKADRIHELVERVYGRNPESSIYTNGLTSENGANADEFLNEHGLDVRKIPANVLLEEIEQSNKNLKEIFRDINFRVITSQLRYDQIRSPKKGESMTVEYSVKNNQMIMKVTGRIDTVTAPAFIEEYKKLKAKTRVNKITIDMGNVIYISSAGIRALLIIFKELGGTGFCLTNLTPELSEIFHTTGLSDTF